MLPGCARNALLSLLILSTCISISYALPVSHDISHLNPTSQTYEHPIIGSPVFWWKLGISLCLILSGGVFAGLTLGLMGLDELHLRVLATSSDDLLEKRNAQKVLKLMGKGRHWVLVSLLLSNVVSVSPLFYSHQVRYFYCVVGLLLKVVNESLPIFLDSAIGGGIAAVVISTTMIVIFGVIPQAVCARYGLAIGAICAPFVLILMYCLSPIAWPIAKLLDWVLGGSESHTYKKAELKSFLQFHRHGEEPLRDDEINILNGVLELNSKRAVDIMTQLVDVVTLSADTIMDHDTLDRLLSSGYSRFPVHEPGKPLSFIGLLLIKTLLRYDVSEKRPVSSFKLSILPEALPSINCFQALDYFQTGRAHLILISETPGNEGGALGVVTLEDVIEEIISEEIVDETDMYESNRIKRRAKRQSTAVIMRGIVEHHLRMTETISTIGDYSPLLSATLLDGRQTPINIDGVSNYGAISSSPYQ